MPIRIIAADRPKRQGRRGQFRTAKKHVPDVAKSAQHPHSKLKTQKELKKITDSGAYKKSDYKGKTAMLGGKSYAKGGAAGRKGLTHKGKPTQTLRDILKKTKPKNWREIDLSRRLGGGEKGKPHSSKEGQKAAGRRRFNRIVQKSRPKTMEQRPLPKWPKQPKHIPATRNDYGLGSLVKKGISKILKPKGVFKPKPVPKAVTDRPTGWSPKGEYTKADDKKITSMLKKLGDEIKAQPLPPKLKATLKKAQKAFPHKKASGGRIGLKHGGSVGAAVRGHGAEIK